MHTKLIRQSVVLMNWLCMYVFITNMGNIPQPTQRDNFSPETMKRKRRGIRDVR